MARYNYSNDADQTFRGFKMPLLADAVVMCAAIGLIALLLPHPPEVREAQAWGLVVVALTAGLVLQVFARRLSRSFDAWAPFVTVAIIWAAVWVGGPGTGAVALASFFNLGAAVMFSFLSWRRIGLTLLLTNAGYAAILAVQDVAGWPALTAVLAGELLGVTFVSRQLVDHLHRLAMEDELTGLVNRRGWYTRVADEMARSRRDATALSIVIVDLDRFKAVNDRHGHEAGDDLLVAIATAWTDTLRAGDQLARWGGDEFALALPDCDRDEAEALVERLVAVMPDGHTFCSGVATWRPDETVDDMIRRADHRLYERKRSRTAVADPDTEVAGSSP